MTTDHFRSYAILPAAGRSRRMGAPKLLLPWWSGTLIEHVVGVWRQSRVDEILVVVAPDDEAMIAACQGLDCRVVVPDQPPPEMKASICRALEYIERQFAPLDTDAWLVAPADLPSLTADVINSVLTAYRPAQPAVVVPMHDGRRGHPVLLPWRRANEVPLLQQQESLKDLLARSSVQEVPVASAAAFDDLDTPQDYQRLHDRQIP